ncbi:MAG: xanthine dehydrogenase family protein molybdopterin-binding subunit [Lachnospiraceae bacterium]|nr:xanthine dehydrogenase family protein molybdopterin-binding subunit [Lachnospiraceae bacterium]
MKKELKAVGKLKNRLIAEDVVTGRAMFTDDMVLPGMAYGKVLRSPHPHAEIVRIDTEKAKAYPGVFCVQTYQDIPDNYYITNHMTPACHSHPLNKIVQYVGDAVAFVTAETEAIAEAAMELIEVEYRLLKPVFTIDEALKEDAPQLYEEFPGNIAPPIFPGLDDLDFQVGDVEKGFAESEVIVEVDAEIHSGHNAIPAEAPVCIAQWNGDILTIYGSIASVSNCQTYVAASLDIPYEQIRMVAPCVGGSFGTKLFTGNVHPPVYAAIMAKGARRPVKFCYTKEEHFACHQTRMSTQAHIKLGLKKDGLASAITVEQYADAGAMAGTQENMLSVGTASLPLLCKTDNKIYKGQVVLTNKVPSGSFRGYGYMESSAMINRAIMRACIKLDLDPVEYFKKNVLRHGERYFNALNQKEPWQYNASPDWNVMIEAAAEGFGWKDRFKGWGVPTSVNGSKRRGVGIGVSGHSDIGGMASNTNVTMTSAGGVIIHTVMTEFGSGVRDVYRKIVAEELDIPVERVQLSLADTSAAPLDFGSVASRSTYAGGSSALRAAKDLKKNLFELAEEKLGIPAEDWDFKGGMLHRISNPEEVHDIHELLIYPDSISGAGHWPGVDNATILHTQLVEVEVDTETGRIEVVDHFGGSDAGTIVNPRAAYNQLTSFFPGIDVAIREETVWDKWDYKVLSPSLIEYKTRTFNDVPHHDHICLESTKGRESDFPFGAMGIGEPLISPSGPAITMAVYNAIGIELEEYPYLPAKVLAAWKAKEAENK